MNDKIKKIKYIRQGEINNYLYSITKNLIKYELKDKDIIFINNNRIIFAIDYYQQTILFSHKYIWSKFNTYNDLKNARKVLTEFIELFFPEYNRYFIFHNRDCNEGRLQQYISKHKLNKLYFKLCGYEDLKCFYALDDCIGEHKSLYPSKNNYKKGAFIYYNGNEYFNINKMENGFVHSYSFPTPNEKLIELDFSKEEHRKILNKYKSHILIDKYNCNYFFK